MNNSAVLHPFNSDEFSIRIDEKEFSIGRAKHASYDIKDPFVSRSQCILRFTEAWTICDKSSVGTWLNGRRLKQNEEMPLQDGDCIRLGELHKYSYVFCTGSQNCRNSCQERIRNPKLGLNAEMAQRRRLFEYQALLEKDRLENRIMEKVQDRHKLELQQKILQDNFNELISKLEEKNQQLQIDLEKKSNSSSTNLSVGRELLEKQFKEEKEKLEEMHVKETSDLASKIATHETAESELKKQNQELLERLEHEKQQFELRLEDEKMILEAKLAEQLAEQQKLAAEKSQVEEALRLRIQEIEKRANLEVEQQQQRQAEREREEERLSKEKEEFEKRLAELQRALEDKERLEKEREKEFQERDQELKVQEEVRECERKEREAKMEADFLARKEELEKLEKQKQEALAKHREEINKELLDREAELERKAEEHQQELEAQKMREQERLRKELDKKEQLMRQQLEWEIFKLQEEKVAIEMNIRGEQSKKEGENEASLEKLRAELDQVKKDLDNTSTKRILLEKELEEASKAKEEASKSELQARKDVIENFGELVESELQCSICNELFVIATTLNCNHTFCEMCITNWLEKKKDCPICRAPSTQQSRSLVLDNFIDRIVENLSEELKKRRKDIVEERRVLAHVAGLVGNPQKKRKTSVPVNVPIPVVNGNFVNSNGMRVLVPVNSVPVGARVVTLSSNNTPAAELNSGRAAGSINEYRIVSTASSTSRTAHTSQLPRQPPLQPQRPSLAPQSSSAPIRTMATTQAWHARPPGTPGIPGAGPRPDNRPIVHPPTTWPNSSIHTIIHNSPGPVYLLTRTTGPSSQLGVPPLHPVHPARPVLPAHPVHPARPVLPAHPVHPARPVLPAHPVHPARPVLPAHPVHPARPVLPAHPAHPARPVYPAPRVASPQVARAPSAAAHTLRQRFARPTCPVILGNHARHARP